MTTYYDAQGKPYVVDDGRDSEPAPQPPARETGSGTALIVLALVFGIVLTVTGLVGPHVAVSHGHSVADVHGMCHSGFGQFAQAIDKGAQTSCTRADLLYNGLLTSLVVGLLLTATGAYAVVRRQRAALKAKRGR